MGLDIPDQIDLSQMELTADQRGAVEHDDGPLIVLAGPGTGKTRVITARVAHMITIRDVNPEQIVAVTFTNKAAGELGERLGELVGGTVSARVVSSTFHSLGLRIIRRFGDVLGVPSEPILIDSSQRKGLVREIIREQGLYSYAMGGGIDSAIGLATEVMKELRNLGMTSGDAMAWLDRERQVIGGLENGEKEARIGELERFEQAALVYSHFESRCLDRGWMEYDDLIMLPSRLMRDHKQIAAILRQDHRHVVVDEFQDVNAAQIEMIRQLCPPESNPDLCVVGDDDQSIYGFRGADDRAFAHFAQIWAGAPTITLSTNYRSAEAIVEASNAVIDRAHVRFDDSKKAVSHAGEVARAGVELVRLVDEKQSGEIIAAMLLKMASDAQESGGKFEFGSCAVIARTGGELERIARVLMIEGIPVEMREKSSPMEDEGVQDVIAWARLLGDPNSSADLRRILARPPYRCDAIKIGGLIAGWKVRRSRWMHGDDDALDPGALLDWLAQHADESDERLGARIRRMHVLAIELGKIASDSTASTALMEIVKRTGVVHSDLGDGRRRASRVAAVVALVSFARSRSDRFESPGDLPAMLRYWEDLDPKEQSLGELPEHRVHDRNDRLGSVEDRGAVAMLTAHASKGLEFETVFIPRVGPPHGYPMTSGSDGEVLPEGLIDRAGDVRDVKARRIDEERRVFYVALTRAHYRAVLLARLPKKSTSTNFVLELRDSLGGGLVEHDECDVLDPAASGDAVSRLGAEFRSASRMRDVFDQARQDERRMAASAIDAMELGEIDRDELANRLSITADRIAVINEVLRSGEVPGWVSGGELGVLAQRLVDVISDAVPDDGGVLHGPLDGPLRLSFTQIAGYLHCPRCYLVEQVLELPSEEASPAMVGKAMHEALEVFYQRWREADAQGEQVPGVDELRALVKKKFFERWPSGIEVEEDKLEQALAMAGTLWSSMHSDDVHIEELEKKISLGYDCGGLTHQIKAVLDRVDATSSGGRRVIDYKTGKPRKELSEPKKDDLQLGIYAMALEEAFGDPGPGSVCEYWLLQDGSVGSIGFDELDMDKIRKKIDKAIAGMLAGVWERSPRCRGGQRGSACSILDRVDDGTSMDQD